MTEENTSEIVNQINDGFAALEAEEAPPPAEEAEEAEEATIEEAEEEEIIAAPKGKRATAEFERANRLERQLEELTQEMKGLRSSDKRNDNIDETLRKMMSNEKSLEEQLDSQLASFNISKEEINAMYPEQKQSTLRNLHQQLHLSNQVHELNLTNAENSINSLRQQAQQSDTDDALAFNNGYKAFLEMQAHLLMTTGQEKNLEKAVNRTRKEIAAWVIKDVEEGNSKSHADAIVRLCTPIGYSLTSKQVKEAKAAEKSFITNGSPANLAKAKAQAGTHDLSVSATKNHGSSQIAIDPEYAAMAKELWGTVL